MLEQLKKKNPNLRFYSVRDAEFKKYGRVLDIDTREMVEEASKIARPESGSAYSLSVETLENLPSAPAFRELLFGGCEAQIGLCHGYSNFLNALEFHKSSELNVAVTPLVLLLGLEYEMEGDRYDAAKVKAFYLEKGDAVEVFGTSMHFCPCQVADDGFSALVILPKNTNDLLDAPSADKLLFKKNKWILCHEKNEALIKRGVYPGIYGENYEVKY